MPVLLIPAFKDAVFELVVTKVDFLEATLADMEAFGFLLEDDFLLEGEFYLFVVLVELVATGDEVREERHHAVDKMKQVPREFDFHILSPFDFVLHGYLLSGTSQNYPCSFFASLYLERHGAEQKFFLSYRL